MRQVGGGVPVLELPVNSGEPEVVGPEAGDTDNADYTAYVVEVCVDCGWNHLMRSYLLA